MTDLKKIYSNIKFHEICPMGDELLHADGETDLKKLIVAFRNFANAPKNEFQLALKVVTYLEALFLSIGATEKNHEKLLQISGYLKSDSEKTLEGYPRNNPLIYRILLLKFIEKLPFGRPRRKSQETLKLI